MCKWMLDTNVLYYSVNDPSIYEKLKMLCPNLFWSEISLEELIAGSDTAEKFEVLKIIFNKTKELNLIVPDTQNFLTGEWGLEPVLNSAEYSYGLMRAVQETLAMENFEQFKDLMIDSKSLCEAKREIFNSDFSEVAKNKLSELRRDKINIENVSVKNENIKEMFRCLLEDQNFKKLLSRIKKSAYSIKAGVLDAAGFDVGGLREFGRFENLVSVPEVTDQEFSEKMLYYECYTRVYAGYCARRIYQVSNRKYKNDSHDLDIMKYLSLGFSIVTAEKDGKKFAGLLAF